MTSFEPYFEPGPMLGFMPQAGLEPAQSVISSIEFLFWTFLFGNIEYRMMLFAEKKIKMHLVNILFHIIDIMC